MPCQKVVKCNFLFLLVHSARPDQNKTSFKLWVASILFKDKPCLCAFWDRWKAHLLFNIGWPPFWFKMAVIVFFQLPWILLLEKQIAVFAWMTGSKCIDWDLMKQTKLWGVYLRLTAIIIYLVVGGSFDDMYLAFYMISNEDVSIILCRIINPLKNISGIPYEPLLPCSWKLGMQ